MKVQTTYHYDKFIFDEHNRSITKNQKLMHSLKVHGWIPAYPMHVVDNGNGKLRIIDGQHRFEYAKTLKLPVTYVVCEREEVSVAAINNAQKPWNSKDYLSSFMRQGLPDYEELGKFVERTGIRLTQATSMLSGESAGSANNQCSMKDGSLKITKEGRAHAELVASVIVEIGGIIKWARDSYFVAAVSKCVRVPQFKPAQFVDRVKNNQSMMIRQATMEQYVQLIEQIYNHRSRDPIPVKFYADELARLRSCGGKMATGSKSKEVFALTSAPKPVRAAA